MNRSYIIFPIILLGIFGFFFWQFSAENEIKKENKAKEAARLQADASSKKEAEIQKAKIDAERRAAEREAEERKKAEDKRQKYQSHLDEIKATTAKYALQAKEAAEKGAALEKELNALRTSKDQLNRETFDLLKAVESAKIDRRNAEFEIQRMTDMIAKKASDSMMAKPPAVAATP